MITYNKRIEMIETHSEKGQVRPVRFRMPLEGELKAFDVKVRVTNEIKVEKDRIITFMCDVIDEGCIKPCELRFYLAGMYWTLYRI